MSIDFRKKTQSIVNIYQGTIVVFVNDDESCFKDDIRLLQADELFLDSCDCYCPEDFNTEFMTLPHNGICSRQQQEPAQENEDNVTKRRRGRSSSSKK